jgi:hypothetical protein
VTIAELREQAARVRVVTRHIVEAAHPRFGPMEHRISTAYGWSGHLIVEAQKMRSMLKVYAEENGIELPK